MRTKIEKTQILQLVAQVSRQPAEKIKPEMSFRGDLRMDSLQSLDLLVLIEEELHVAIPQAEAVKIQTVQQLFDYFK